MGVVPESARRVDREHWEFAREKTRRRLELGIEREDLLSFFVRDNGKGKEGLSEDEVYANAHFITLAGSETTVTVLTGIFNKLLGKPECLRRLTVEVRERFEDEDDITLGKLKELPYLNAVIEEGLRMCNPTPGGTVNSRITPKEGGMISGHSIPGETFVSTWPCAMSFSPEYFHDPEVFHPERWLSNARESASSPFYNDKRKASQPFGLGLRVCIGQSIAWAEMRLVLAKLLWNFDVREPVSGDPRCEWNDQRVFGVVEKKPLSVELVSRTETR